jgi:enediyne biosynthesis protein E4
MQISPGVVRVNQRYFSMKQALFLALAMGGAFLVGCPKTEKPLPSAAPLFRNVLKESGIRYRWEITGKRPLNILQTIGNGCAFLDYDSDGNLDILLVGPKIALYHGDGHGKFLDVSQETGVEALSGHLLGCAVGDYDADGFPDAYLTGWRGGVLLHNEGGKRFVDVSAAMGIQPETWGTSAAFVQRSRSVSKLDLIVCNYANFGPEPGIRQLCEVKDRAGKPVLTSCGPRSYTPIAPSLYRFNAAGTLDRTVLKQATGRGLGIAAIYDEGQETPSITIANDEIAGDLLQEQKQVGVFQNVAAAANTAYDRDGNVHGGMGTDWGDADSDGKFDLIVSTFQNETKSLYRNEGNGVFSDISYACGLSTITSPPVAFGVRFLDFDNDGWLDLVIANGHVQDNIADIDSGTSFRQSAQLIRNKGIGPDKRQSFEDVSKAGPDLQTPIVGRGLATGDYDNDGKIDVLIVDAEGEPLLLHNEQQSANHWIGLKLIGTKSNRDAYGARVTLEVGGRKLVRHCHADGSYMSSSDARLHFGLETSTKIDRVTILWPSGASETHTDLPIDTYTIITEGKK